MVQIPGRLLYVSTWTTFIVDSLNQELDMVRSHRRTPSPLKILQETKLKHKTPGEGWSPNQAWLFQIQINIKCISSYLDVCECFYLSFFYYYFIYFIIFVLCLFYHNFIYFIIFYHVDICFTFVLELSLASKTCWIQQFLRITSWFSVASGGGVFFDCLVTLGLDFQSNGISYHELTILSILKLKWM